MNSNSRTRQQEDWEKLQKLLELAESRGRKSLHTEQLVELGTLYRRAAAALSRARTNVRERNRIEALNQLVARAHAQVYRPKRRSPLRAFARLLRIRFPASAWVHSGPVATSAATLLLGFLLGWGLVTNDPSLYYAIVPLEELRSPGSGSEALLESLRNGRDASQGELSAFSGMLWQHNTKVALFAFALGAAGGVFGYLLVLYNGLMIGAMTSAFHSADLTTPWFAWLAGHGVTELSAIVLCSGAGIGIGRAALFPGTHTRADAMNLAARTALPLAGGGAVMLFLAALLEGFFRQSEASDTLRFAVAGLSALAWALYFYSGRSKQTMLTLAPASQSSGSKSSQ